MSWIWVRLTSLSTKRDLEKEFTAERGGRILQIKSLQRLRSIFREPSRITHQLGKGDLKAKSTTFQTLREVIQYSDRISFLPVRLTSSLFT